MKTLAVLFLLLALPAAAQDAKKWKPYQFSGDERYEYKVTTLEGDEKKESGFVLDVRKKGSEDWDVTWSTKAVMKRTQGPELLMGGLAMVSPTVLVMNPVFGIFLEQVDLKVGEKMSLLGAGLVKVVRQEQVGGRTGYVCELYTKQEDKDVLAWSCTIDPALALPIRSRASTSWAPGRRSRRSIHMGTSKRLATGGFRG
jgi:hypothetical protein